jgi:hypothetical protein
MKKQTVGNALKTIAKEVPQELAGRSIIEDLKKEVPETGPDDLLKMMKIIQNAIIPLKPFYGTPVIGHGKCVVHYLRFPIGDPHHPEEEMEIPGTYWKLEFPNHQLISVVITENGKIVERDYCDRGDIPIGEVYKFLRSWQASFIQAQNGGRPTGMSDTTKNHYIEIAKGFYSKDIRTTELEYCLDYNPPISLRTLHRALDFASKQKRLNDLNFVPINRT